MRSRTHRSAFTLIELMIVIAVVIILTAIGGPVLGNAVTERGVVRVAVQLQQDIRVVQQYAITRRVPSSISFDIVGQTYTYTVGTTTRVRHMTSVVHMDLVNNGVDPFSGTSGALSFDSFGSPGTATSTSLKAAIQIEFQTVSGSKRMIVAIQPVLGRVDTTWVTP